MSLPPSILIALGGNAIVRPGEAGTVASQLARARESMSELAALLAGPGQAPRVVITHGNGPQVGDVLLRGELARTEMGPLPLDMAVADTQGFLGCMLARLLRDELERREVKREVMAVVTHVLVDPNDPAFGRPEKPVGAYYPTELQARRPGWVIREFPPRGFRRVVPSPRPLAIVERDSIEVLYRSGAVVIAAGGGGIPVTRRDGRLTGVEAVIDKDLTSALLASELGIDTLAILTGVERVQVDYGTPRARDLEDVTAAELAEWQAQGQFPAGSMGPKVEAALGFLARGGRHVLITAEDRLMEGLAGRVGTHVRRRNEPVRVAEP
jgi:carbamate kinase